MQVHTLGLSEKKEFGLAVCADCRRLVRFSGRGTRQSTIRLGSNPESSRGEKPEGFSLPFPYPGPTLLSWQLRVRESPVGGTSAVRYKAHPVGRSVYRARPTN